MLVDLETKRARDHEYSRKRCAADPERERERTRRRVAANPERERERWRRYREANRDKIRARYRQKFEWLDNYRRSRGCVDCGTTEGQLHSHAAGPGKRECRHGAPRGHRSSDHRDDEVKVFNPADGAVSSWPRLKAEVAKCDVRCVSCHSKRHAAARRAA